jgi:hypothetical protein
MSSSTATITRQSMSASPGPWCAAAMRSRKKVGHTAGYSSWTMETRTWGFGWWLHCCYCGGGGGVLRGGERLWGRRGSEAGHEDLLLLLLLQLLVLSLCRCSSIGQPDAAGWAHLRQLVAQKGWQRASRLDSAVALQPR